MNYKRNNNIYNNYKNKCCPPLAYICCGIGGKIAVVDLINKTHIMDIFCEGFNDLYYIAISPNLDYAYIADYSGKSILKLDLMCNRIVKYVSVVGKPRSIDISLCGNFVYVVFDDEPVMQILNGKSLDTINQFSLPTSGGSVTVTNNNAIIYVTQPSLNQTAVIDLCNFSIIKMINTGINPGRSAISYEKNLIMIAGRGSNNLIPINTCTMLTNENIYIDASPSGLTFIENGKKCLVNLREENKVSVVDIFTNQIISHIPVGNLPGDIAASKVLPIAVVGNQYDGTLSIINTETLSVSKTLNICSDPVGIAIVE